MRAQCAKCNHWINSGHWEPVMFHGSITAMCFDCAKNLTPIEAEFKVYG